MIWNTFRELKSSPIFGHHNDGPLGDHGRGEGQTHPPVPEHHAGEWVSFWAGGVYSEGFNALIRTTGIFLPPSRAMA
jgi:hypothetical protein